MQDIASKNAYFFRTRSEDKSNLSNRPNTFSFINLLTDKIYLKTEKNPQRPKSLWIPWDALTKKIPAENENSGSGFDLFSFLHCDFSIFAFGCPASKKEGSHENVVWILSSLSRKRGRNLDVSFLSSKFRPLFKKQLRQNE